MKSRFVIVVLLVFALAVPASMLATSKDEQQIRALIEESRQANLKGGAEAIAMIDKNTTDDYVRIPSNGAILSKADVLNGFKTEGIKVEKTEWYVDKVRVYGNWALVTGTDVSSWTLNGQLLQGTNRWSRVMVKKDGKWKFLLHQSTRMPAKQ